MNSMLGTYMIRLVIVPILLFINSMKRPETTTIWSYWQVAVAVVDRRPEVAWATRSHLHLEIRAVGAASSVPASPPTAIYVFIKVAHQLAVCEIRVRPLPECCSEVDLQSPYEGEFQFSLVFNPSADSCELSPHSTLSLSVSHFLTLFQASSEIPSEWNVHNLGAWEQNVCAG